MSSRQGRVVAFVVIGAVIGASPYACTPFGSSAAELSDGAAPPAVDGGFAVDGADAADGLAEYCTPVKGGSAGRCRECVGGPTCCVGATTQQCIDSGAPCDGMVLDCLDTYDCHGAACCLNKATVAVDQCPVRITGFAAEARAQCLADGGTSCPEGYKLCGTDAECNQGRCVHAVVVSGSVVNDPVFGICVP